MIDLVHMKAHTFVPDGDGKSSMGEIPADYAEAAQAAHAELVEIVAEGKDDLMEEFFEKGTLPEEHIVSGLDEEMREDLIAELRKDGIEPDKLTKSSLKFHAG